LEKCQKAKEAWGLGVLDLELFSHALRLRWLWFSWTDPYRPWVGSEVPCNEVDQQLFRASAVVSVGNGRRAQFWESSWLEGQVPRDIAPNLYKLAWRKQQSVRDDLHDNNWTRGIWRMTTVIEMAELVHLWGLVENIVLNEQEDTIRLRWTTNGCYSAKSAYRAQFHGSYCSFDNKAIWGPRWKINTVSLHGY
jgi:hypothetical protein